jgi:hypothetical protein
MHYANGREAKFGDLVKGRGYNLKHEFTGVVCNLRPDSKDMQGNGTCNISIATVTKTAIFQIDAYLGTDGVLSIADPAKPFAPVRPVLTTEYGQADQFLAIDPATGEVLPPEA